MSTSSVQDIYISVINFHKDWMHQRQINTMVLDIINPYNQISIKV